MAHGYMGKMLWVNLSTKEIREEDWDEELGRKYLGGYGLGAKILFDRQPAGVDPLGPEAILGFLTGPATGTATLGASRYVVVGKSPLTGGWGDANSGGDVGPYIKFAGYDGIFFTGISDEPVYLFVDNGKAELRDAAHLWGKDTFDTDDLMKAELGADIRVACIGPSGENLALIASIMNDKGRAAARSGLGAVMGSKKLKAVAVKGKMSVPQADEERVKELRRTHIRELTGPFTMLRDIGTPGIFNGCAEAGDAPTKNWSSSAPIDFPNFADIGAGPVMDRVAKKYACYRCPVGCGGHMKEGTGEHKYAAGAKKPEYETLGLYGSSCLNSDIDSIILANDICNRYGVDTISAGGCMAFCIECYERGILTKEDTDGLEMTWGNHRSIVAMTEKLVKREGFGDVLADGVKKAADIIGKGSEEYAIHVGGQEFAAHDPRFNLAYGISYRMDATPGRHTQSGEGPHCPGVMPQDFDPKDVKQRGAAHQIGVSFSHFYSCFGLCMFVEGCYSHASVIVDFLNAITGWDLSMNEVLEIGDRITNIRQAFNVREGLNPLTFKTPGRVFGNPPQEAGPHAGVSVAEEALAREYLAFMDWAPETTKPSKKRLSELQMEDVAAILWP